MSSAPPIHNVYHSTADQIDIVEDIVVCFCLKVLNSDYFLHFLHQNAKPKIKKFFFQKDKDEYFVHSDNAFSGNVVNRACHSINR